jgi:hypothetical protein
MVLSSMTLMRAVMLLAAVCATAQERAQWSWEGEVDGIVVLHVRGDRSDVEERSGKQVARGRARFFSRLPEHRQDVRLEVQQGRGNVRIVQQPRPENNYTASIEIDDRQGGSSLYMVDLYWDSSRAGLDPPKHQPRPRRPPGAGEEHLTWTGRVDGEAVIACRENDCRAETVRGGPVTRDRASFSHPLPDREVRVSLDDIDGRGEVELVEPPSAANGWAANVRIRDPQGGAGDYGFSLFWRPPPRHEPERLFARPGLVWSGRVDGTVRVIVQENSATIDVLNGAPVTGERSNFTRALPRRGANVSVQKLRGRGSVEVIEAASERNGGRVIFEIRDTFGGADSYEVEVSW